MKLSDLDITDGAISEIAGTFHTSSAGMRATVRGSAGRSIGVTFRYHGESPTVEPLGSGAIRHQLCLKLLAQDPCNLLYVEWRFDESKIVVQSKLNPGKSTSKACGNAGYGDVYPVWWSTTRQVRTGEENDMIAGFIGGRLVVLVDEDPCWVGMPVGPVASLVGPAGIRTDNINVDFNLWVP